MSKETMNMVPKILFKKLKYKNRMKIISCLASCKNCIYFYDPVIVASAFSTMQWSTLTTEQLPMGQWRGRIFLSLASLSVEVEHVWKKNINASDWRIVNSFICVHVFLVAVAITPSNHNRNNEQQQQTTTHRNVLAALFVYVYLFHPVRT